MTTMRPSLLPGLLGALQGNLARNDATPRLGEVGKVFGAKGERLSAAVGRAGAEARHWLGAAGAPGGGGGWAVTRSAAALVVAVTTLAMAWNARG